MEEVLRRSYRYCEWITRRHYENFPVGSRLLPARMRPRVAALYAFARSADDFADEQRYRGRSLELLQRWREMLWSGCASPRSGSGFTRAPSSPHEEVAGSSVNARSSHPPSGAEATPSVRADPEQSRRIEAGSVNHPIFLALADTVRRHDLPVQLLDDLLTAFAMDVTKRRYANWDELMNYCRHSANPVGRLVLLLSGVRDEELHRRSDDICTALQLANHWQDLRADLARGILYIPQDLMRSHSVTEAEMKSYSPRPGAGSFALGPSGLEGTSRRRTPLGPQSSRTHLPGGARVTPSPEFRALMADLVGRARALFDSGEPLVGRLKGGLRLEIRLTLLGGRAILDRIEAADYDVFRRRPQLSRLDKLSLLAQGLITR